MDQSEITMKCFRCRKSFKILEMVMDSSGKGMSCRTCAGLPPRGSAPPQVEKKEAPREARHQYHCLDCKYKFTSGKTKDELYCPYCGGHSVSARAKNSASILLEEASSRRYEY